MLSGLLVHFNCSQCLKRNQYNVILLEIRSLRNCMLLHFFHDFFFFLKAEIFKRWGKDDTDRGETCKEYAGGWFNTPPFPAAHTCDQALSAWLPRPTELLSAWTHVISCRLSLWWLFPFLALLWPHYVSGRSWWLRRPRLIFPQGRRELSLGEWGESFVWVFLGLNVE